MGSRLRVGVIGLGRVAWQLELDPLERHPCTHVGAWIERDDIELVAGCDTDAGQRDAFAKAYPDIAMYEDYAEMLAQEGLDCVSICAYATEREEMIHAVLQAGVRGIWAEKALGCSLAEIDRIGREIEAQGAVLMVSYMRRWGADYLQVRDALAAGEIGCLQTITAQFSGNLLHTGTHAFDTMQMLAGTPRTVRGWLEAGAGRVQDSGYRFEPYRQNKDDIQDIGGHAVIEYGDGLFGFVQGQARNYFWFEFELQGSRGLIRVGNEQFEMRRRARSRRHTGFHELARKRGFKPAPGKVWRAACADLVAAVREGRSTGCGVPEARIALATALAVHASARAGGVPVRLEEVDAELYVPSR